MDITLWFDLPQWALQFAPGAGGEHWQLALAWLDVSLTLVCY